MTTTILLAAVFGIVLAFVLALVFGLTRKFPNAGAGTQAAAGETGAKAMVAVLACRGTQDASLPKGEYTGVKNCFAAKISTGSIKRCTWGCQGFGDCVKACKSGAISMGKDGLPRIDSGLCSGCKACTVECPQHIIWIIPRDSKGSRPVCSNLNVNKDTVKENCKNGCTKCELCITACPGQCIKMANGIPVVDSARCTSCGTCAAKCPAGVFTIM